jgi:hypothetical protein
MFDGPMLTSTEYDAYVIACLETEFEAEYPDPAEFVTDEHQRFLDSRARLLSVGAAHLDGAVGANRVAARAAASRARALAAFARSRPAAMFDRAPGERGAASAASVAARPAVLTEVSEWAVDEAAATLGMSGRAASLELVDALTLVEGLPASLAALDAGEISPAHARAMVELAGPVSTADRRAEVEAAVLPPGSGTDGLCATGVPAAGGRPHRRRRGRRTVGEGGTGPAGAAGGPGRRDLRPDRAVGDSGRAGVLRGVERLRQGLRVRRGRQP